jgi:iron complex outermembrane receptor protein
MRYTWLSNATGLNQDKGTPEFGILYRPIKDVSVYYNISETFLPNYQLDAFNHQLAPTVGEGHDIGLKFDLLDSKLSLTMAIYKESETNIPVVNVPLELITGITPLYDTGGLEETAGFESDLTYSISRNDQLVMSFSNSWEHRTIYSSTVLMDNIPLAYVAKYNFDIWDKYTFDTGLLKGFYIGAGAKARSGGVHLNPSYSVALYGGGSCVWNGLLGYRIKLGTVTWNLSYSVQNLFNEVYYSGYLQYAEPRQQLVSARLSF